MTVVYTCSYKCACVYTLYKCKGHFNSARVYSVESVQRVSIIAHIIYSNGCAFISLIIIFCYFKPPVVMAMPSDLIILVCYFVTPKRHWVTIL